MVVDVIDMIAHYLMPIDGIRGVFVHENLIESQVLKNFSVMHF